MDPLPAAPQPSTPQPTEPAPGDTSPTEPVPGDLDLLRRAIAVSERAVAHGNHPFGALLTDPTGAVVLEAENSVVTGRDVTGHAETNLVRLAWRELGGGADGAGAAGLRGHTLYTSCEPCAMCSGAIYWAGIGRVVYAMSETTLLSLTGDHPENPTLAVPCRTVLQGGSTRVEVTGPALEDEAAAYHRGFWT